MTILNLTKKAMSSLNGQKTLSEKEKLLVMSSSPFPTVFSKDLYTGHVKSRASLGKVKPS